ncbi:MAG: branched-chain amino acid ABC transporter substrate-binding protein [Chloroflexi bacterium]|nr:branched-chain amino acid ABC transporter substrate-binding protein [Chloroflexota bacterium]
MDLRRLGAIAIAAMLLGVACQPGPGGSPSLGGTDPVGSPTGGDPTDDATDTATDEPATDEPATDEPTTGTEAGSVTIAAGAPITIGTALVITGANEALGLDSQYGAEVAVQMRSEVLGHPVQFNHQDDGCSPEGGQTAARALVSDPQIVAVIGTSCSSAGIPAAEITSDAGVVMVSPSNTAPSLTDPATHEPFYLRTAHNDKVQGEAMARFACEELSVTTAATIHDGSAYAEQLQQVFVDNFEQICDGTITAQEAINPGDTDFRPLLTSIASGNPEFLYYPVFVAEGGLITSQARQTTGLEETALAGSDGIFTPDFLDAAGGAAEDMYLSGPDLEFAGSFYEEQFLPAYADVSGENQPISVFHAHAFDATNMILDAIEEVAVEGEDGSLTIDRQALADALFATSGFEGITGNLTCGENGDCADPKISVSQVQDNDFVRIWPEE